MNAAWLGEVQRRIAISEGCEATRYYDSKGIATVGIGFNLTRADAYSALLKAGVAPTQVQGVIDGDVALTQEQIAALFAYSFAPVISEARSSLAPGIFDALTDARRFVICDLVYNLGYGGWLQFNRTRGMIADAQRAKQTNAPNAHGYFVDAANDLRQSDWFNQVGWRAKRDCAMLEVGVYCSPTGDGSDILS